MAALDKIYSKILQYDDLQVKLKKWKEEGSKIVFTNGCFDIIHRGHIELLAQAANLGDKLIIGLNSDSSIQKIKGVERPILDEKSRAVLLASLSFSDAIITFHEETPLNLINLILPAILVKGNDYKTAPIIGQDIVENTGGKVILLPFVDGISTSKIIDKIKNY